LLRGGEKEGAAVVRVLKLSKKLNAVLEGPVALVERVHELKERPCGLVPEAV
jgi:hypothetical protein